MIKESIQKEYTTLINICAPNMGTPKHSKLRDIKEELTTIQKH